MGNRLGRKLRSIKNWSTSLRERKRQKRKMQQHFKTLVNVLALEDLKREIPEVEIPVKKEEHANNTKELDSLEALNDLFAKAQLLEENMPYIEEKTNDDDDEVEISSDEETEIFSEFDRDSHTNSLRKESVHQRLRRGPRKLSAIASKRFKRIMKSISVVKSSNKTKFVDVFAVPGENTGASWLQKALDIHDLVEYIENEITDINEMRESRKSRMDINSDDIPTKLIIPGTILSGSIHIPGKQNSNYILSIIRQNTNELGDAYFIAHHIKGSNQDKQAVTIDTLEEEKKIMYEDIETSCEGWLNESSIRGRLIENKLEGMVNELTNGEEGFYEEQEPFHKFRLERDNLSQHKEAIVKNTELLRAKAGRAMAFAAWCLIAPSSKISSESFPGRKIDWGEILEDMLWLVEEINANLRRQAALLKKLKFASISDRKKQLDKLSKKGISRTQAHSSWDAATVFLNAVKERRPAGSDFSSKYNNVYTDMERSLQHQGSSYERLDQALRSASSRLCEDLLTEWQKVFPENSSMNELDHDECPICLEKVESTIIVPPCKHGFHSHCGRKWFHQKTYCPICKKDYATKDD